MRGKQSLRDLRKQRQSFVLPARSLFSALALADVDDDRDCPLRRARGIADQFDVDRDPENMPVFAHQTFFSDQILGFASQ